MMGRRIAALRKAKDMSQLQLGEFLCVSASTVGMYEQGRRVPDIQTLVQLTQFFEVSLDYLITGKERQGKPLPSTGQFELIWQEDGSILLKPVK